MTQRPNPQLPSQTNKSAIQKSSSPKTSGGRKTEEILEKLSEPFDLLGKWLMGDLWRTFYLTVQDAIALALILQAPGLIGRLILGKSFSSFDICLKENPLGVDRYACFIIVASDFCLWILLAGRIVLRFFEDFVALIKNRKVF